MKRAYNLIIMFATFGALIYQVQIIYEEYMSGKTIINLGKRAAKFHASFTDVFKNYKELVKNN